jgi:hypothetical protein
VIATYQPVASTCPACNTGHDSQSAVYQFARAYLCANHRLTWDAAFERAHRGGKCPIEPRPCGFCRLNYGGGVA